MVQRDHADTLELVEADLQFLPVLVLIEVDVPAKELGHYPVEVFQAFLVLGKRGDLSVKHSEVLVQMVDDLEADHITEDLVVITVYFL